MRKFPLFLLTAIIPTLNGCPSNSTQLSTEEEDKELQITRGSFRNHTILSGTIQSADSATITSPNGAWGLSIRWLAEDGINVKKGDKLLSMDTTELTREIDTAEVNVTNSRQALLQERQKGQIGISEKRYQLRQSDNALSKAKLDAEVPQGTYPRRTYESMQLAYKRALADMEGAKQSLTSEKKIGINSIKEKTIAVTKAERNYEALQKKMATYILVAPRDGLLVISENRREGRSYQIGDKTWPGQTILQLPKLSKMIVDAKLSDVDDGRIYVGMKATCILDAYPNIEFPGEVMSISPVAQAPSYRSLRRSFEVRIRLDKTDETKMRPGMSVQVIINDLTKENVLLVPRQSLAFSGENTTAILANGNEAAIELGACSEDQCIVLSGIGEGTNLRRRLVQ